MASYNEFVLFRKPAMCISRRDTRSTGRKILHIADKNGSRAAEAGLPGRPIPWQHQKLVTTFSSIKWISICQRPVNPC